MDDDLARHEDPQGEDRPDLRVGDADRQAAMRALGKHLEAGRLDVDEYGDRAGLAAAAVRRAELAALFDDLPSPHPVLPERHDPALPVPVEESATPGVRPDGRAAAAQAVVFALVMVMTLALPGLLFAAGTAGVGGGGLLFLPLILILASGARHGRRRFGGPGGH